MSIQRDNDRQPQPLTTLACIVSIIIWGSIQFTGGRDVNAAVQRWGAVDIHDVYSGKWQQLLTAVFVHAAIWHLFFNLSWIWTLGNALERALGPLRYLAFFLLAAFVSSSLQLTLNGPGIGLSGVIYAMIGFGWLARDRYDELRMLLPDQSLKLALWWLVGCWVATWLNWINIGNEAHFFGLLFGVGVGALFVRRWKPALSGAGLALLLAASVVPLIWAPWSETWVSDRAYSAHARGDLPTAAREYRQALRLGADREWVWRNLAAVYAGLGDEAHFQEAREQLRKLGVNPDAGDAEKP